MASRTPRKYRLTLTDEHLYAILRGTEFFERIAMGQFREILDVVDPQFKLSREERDQGEQLLTLARRYLMPDLRSDNSFFGIRSPELTPEASICYDFLQVVRHRLAWDAHPEGGITINFDEPMRTSKKLDLVEIEALPHDDSSSSEVSRAQSGGRSTSKASGSKLGSNPTRGKRKAISPVGR